ncbi:cytochrome P450, partial [Frankia casuarinae]|uniref:cytochrome P450 n=2 Tax=Frankia TaxID=1854 RepID=UPI001F31E0BA
FSSEPVATSLDDLPEEVQEFAGSIISLDAPRHTRLRRIAARVFTPRMVTDMTAAVGEIAERIVDDLEDARTCDFVETVAAPMPMRVMRLILGVPEELEKDLFNLTDMILAAGDPEYSEVAGGGRAETLVRKYRQLHALMHQLAEERRQDPRDDLITRLINANVDGDHLTRDELGKFFTLLIVAGAETARNALSHALALLTEHPEQRSTLLGDLPGRLPGAVEEVIRYATPTTWMRRTLVRPAELSGNVYQPGDRVVMFYNSANRDAAVFDAPDRFDITRDPNPHLGFGGPGPHWCLGAHLARHEITIMLKELLTRLPNVHVSGPAVRQRSSFSNGIKELPCSF